MTLKMFSFENFKTEILTNIGQGYKTEFEKYETDIKESIFDVAAKNDGGKYDDKFESDQNAFKQLVQKGIEWLQNVIKKDLEHEGDELWDEDCFDKFNNNTGIKSNDSTQRAASQKTTSDTGNIVSVMNDDQTSLQINYNNHTIAKYDANGNVIGTRAMTSDEKTLSAQDLINSIKNEQVKELPLQTVQGQIQHNNWPTDETPISVKGNGISGLYTINMTEDGRLDVKTKFSVTSDNQALQAYGKGLLDQVVITIKPDNQGVYHFRNLKSTSYNKLVSMTISSGQTIAGYTAIYNDLNEKQKKGINLNSAEEKFIESYLQLLQNNNLQINANGELQELSSKRRKK